MQYDVAVAWGQGNPTHYVAEKVTSEIKLAVINVNYEKAGHNKNFDKPYYEKYHYIVNVSDELCKLSKEVFPDFACKMVTIYDINNPDLIFKMSLAENPFEYETVPLKIVTVGRMTEQKGYDLAVGAAKLLKDRGIQFKWYFVGDGVCREEIEMLITKNELTDYVVLVGVQENPYVYMKNADIYVQTSRFEGYCLTLCEARMLNKPIVSTNFDVVYNQLKNEENGLIVEMNTDAIAEGIVRLWNDVDLKNHIISNLEKEKKGNVEEIEKIYALFLE